MKSVINRRIKRVISEITNPNNNKILRINKKQKLNNKVILSSEIPSALNENLYESRRNILYRKCHNIDYLDNELTKWNEQYKNIAENYYIIQNPNIKINKPNQDKTNKLDSNNFKYFIKHHKYNWLITTIDGITDNGKLLKFVCPKHRNIENNIPNYYWIQIQIQLEICNLQECKYIECKFIETKSIRQFNKIKENSLYNGHYVKNNNKIYWILKTYSVKNIIRDYNWFKQNINEIINFRKELTYYKKAGLAELTKNYTLQPNIIKKSTQIKKSKRKKSLKKDITFEDALNNPELVINKINWNEWISATKVRNFLIDDPLLDWINLYGHSINILNSDLDSSSDDDNILDDNLITDDLQEINLGGSVNNINSAINQLMQQGIEFEEKVVQYLYNKYPKQIITICNMGQAHSINKFIETYNAMKKGIPIICQGVLYNFDDKTYGLPDILIRSDYINKLFKNNKLSKKEYSIGASKINQNKYHYRVIDIKLTKLHFNSDGIHLRNSGGNIKAYKGQVLIYNRALANIQGYNPNVAYLLGRRWYYEKILNGIKYKYGNNNCFDRLGKCDFNEWDNKYISKTDNAIEWIRDVRNIGSKWKLLPNPSRSELYPNMSNSQDYPWYKFKKILAFKLNEITDVIYCGPKNRYIAHSNGIYKWNDPECTSENLGIYGPKISKLVDIILDVNRSKDILVYPDKININYNNWKEKELLEFFVDFESVTDVISDFSNMPYSDSENLIFLIGLGYINPDTNIWEFKYFNVNRLTNDEEKRILEEWYFFMIKLAKKYGYYNLPKIFHYGHHEKSTFNYAKNKHKFEWDINTWFDFYSNIIYKEPVCVNGSLKLGLKPLAKAMYKHKLIDTIWDNNSICNNGLDAMFEAKRCNNDAISRNISMIELPELKEIIKYNETDCKVLWNIITYLRNNHT
jgi:hypothetical protein